MIKALIPTADYKLNEVKGICAHFGCKVKYHDRTRTYFEITSDDATNIFWLGANWNNGYINQLLRENQKLSIA